MEFYGRICSLCSAGGLDIFNDPFVLQNSCHHEEDEPASRPLRIRCSTEPLEINTRSWQEAGNVFGYQPTLNKQLAVILILEEHARRSLEGGAIEMFGDDSHH